MFGFLSKVGIIIEEEMEVIWEGLLENGVNTSILLVGQDYNSAALYEDKIFFTIWSTRKIKFKKFCLFS